MNQAPRPAPSDASVPADSGGRDPWSAPWEDVVGLELFPGVHASDDVWVLPVGLTSGGPARRVCTRTIRFSAALPDGWRLDELRSQEVIRRAKRLSLMLLSKCVLDAAGRILNPPVPYSWVAITKDLCRSMKAALEIGARRGRGAHTFGIRPRCPDGNPVFADLTVEEFKELGAAVPTFALKVVPRMNGFLRMGLMDDWPAPDVSFRKQEAGKFTPFGDEFAAAMLGGALWLAKVAGPDILACFEAARALQFSLRAKNPNAAVLPMGRLVTRWEGEVLKQGFRFPFGFRTRSVLDGAACRGVLSAWPPVNYIEFKSLVLHLEGAHMVLLAAGTLGRSLEVAELPWDCLEEGLPHAKLTGATFKTSEAAEGTPRAWRLPHSSAYAVRQQQRLARVAVPGCAQLFPAWRAGSAAVAVATEKMTSSFVGSLILPDGQDAVDLCEGSPHFARHRTTGVRWAGLSMPNPTETLRAVLGHSDRDTTLSYLLADPEIQFDMQITAERALEAFQKEPRGCED